MTDILIDPDEPYDITNFNRYLIEGCYHSPSFDYLYDYGKGYYQQIVEPTYVVSLAATSRFRTDRVTCYGFSIMYEDLFNLSMLNVVRDWLRKTGMAKEWLRLYRTSELDSDATDIRLHQVTNLALYELHPVYHTYTLALRDQDFKSMVSMVGETLNNLHPYTRHINNEN